MKHCLPCYLPTKRGRQQEATQYEKPFLSTVLVSGYPGLSVVPPSSNPYSIGVELYIALLINLMENKFDLI